MFTGLVEDVGRVERVEALASGNGRRLTVAARLLDEQQPLGASIAVDGVCLTVTAWQKGRASFEVGPETLERSTLGELAASQPVNLERPVRLGDRLGGHLVAGHVDGVGRVESAERRGEAVDLSILVAPGLGRYLVEKGSVAVDGISLTVNATRARGLDGALFIVSLIPHTQAATTLTKKVAGTRVNVEVDLIGKYVEKLCAGYAPPRTSSGAPGISLAQLKEHGYVDE